MRYLLPLILAAVLSSPAVADHCPGGKCPARVVPVPYAVPQAAPVYRSAYRVTVRERIVTGERRPVRRAMGRVFGFMGACR